MKEKGERNSRAPKGAHAFVMTLFVSGNIADGMYTPLLLHRMYTPLLLHLHRRIGSGVSWEHGRDSTQPICTDNCHRFE